MKFDEIELFIEKLENKKWKSLAKKNFFSIKSDKNKKKTTKPYSFFL